MSTESVVWKIISSSIFEYETSKVVQIKSWKIGILYRLFQLGIVLYVSLWVMYHDKGYQTFDYPVAGVTAKLKGIAFANLSNVESIGTRVWDTADFVIPPQQNSAFFVATNMVITPNQTLGYCDESTDVYGLKCFNNTQCKAGKFVHLGSGIETGKCVTSTKIANTSVCEIYGWCPTEHDIMPINNEPLLASAPNFTVLLKNSIEFPNFKIKRRNILKWMEKDFLRKCRYNPFDEWQKFCPIFSLGDIIKYSKATNQKNIWTHGGLMSIHIEWNCNLDFDVEKCGPEYTFRRLDDFKGDVGKGWNFRYSYHYMENGVEKRTLTKVYGIQFFITVSGRGGKFNFFKFSMNMGSGLALLGIASVLCDLFVLNIVRKRELYKKARVDSLKSILNQRGGGENRATRCKHCQRDFKKLCNEAGYLKRNKTFENHSPNSLETHQLKCNQLDTPTAGFTPTVGSLCDCTLKNSNFIDNYSPDLNNKNDREYPLRLNNIEIEQNSNDNQLTNTNSFSLSHSYDCVNGKNPNTDRQVSIHRHQRHLNDYVRICRSTDLPFMDD